MSSYSYTPMPYAVPPELAGQTATHHAARRHPVVIVGAGPVGLTAAIDLAQQGLPVLVLDDDDTVSVGSRAICWAKRSLEIWDRLGVAGRMVDKGVTWQTGHVFHGDEKIYSFDLLPERGHKMPAFINLQQYYVEQYLIEHLAGLGDLAEIRWKNRVIGLRQDDDGVTLEIETPDGRYALQADWVIAADGARSPLRGMLDLPFEGRVFDERFLIADIRTELDLGNERRFWFAPTFHPGESALMHRQPDNIFRVDFQLAADADPDLEVRPERVRPRVQAAIGAGVPFELEWCSIYRFRCARLQRFVHGRVIFAGDSAHVVSPFGARGGNGGIQDVDNLCWKLLRIIRGQSPAALLETYDEERGHGSDENIRHSARSTRFMTPKTAAERDFRDGVLALAHDFPFARQLVNGGRLSKPCDLAGFGLQTPAEADCAVPPGRPCPDAPLADAVGRPSWLLDHLGGMFALLHVAPSPPVLSEGFRRACEGVKLILVSPPGEVSNAPANSPDWTRLTDRDGVFAARYGGRPQATWLIRPDQHVAACFGAADEARLLAALARAGMATEARA